MVNEKNDSPENKRPPEDLVQRIIDPRTGRDITAEYITTRLEELEQLANDIIRVAVEEVTKHPQKTKEVYEKTYWEIHEKLGMGSIGPATAAGGPLMDEKKMTLAKLLGINQKDMID